VATEIEALLLRANIQRCQPPLPDSEVRQIAASVALYPAGGPDPLQRAWEVVENLKQSGFQKFIALAEQLQLSQPDRPIVLPLERIAALMALHWTSVRNYRRLAVDSGLLSQADRAIPHRKAATFNVLVGSTSFPIKPTKPTNDLVGALSGKHSLVGEDRGALSGNAVDACEESARKERLFSLADRNFRLFPCKKAGKEPQIRAWNRAATNDKRQIELWCQQFADCNWGLATGAGSKVFVLDLDSHLGLNSFWELCYKNFLTVDAIVSGTLATKTPNGAHIYFEYPTDGVIRNSASKVAARVDIRGEGGYVLVPPSVHPSGETYRWTAGCDEKTQIANAPAWLLDILTQDQFGVHHRSESDVPRMAGLQ